MKQIQTIIMVLGLILLVIGLLAWRNLEQRFGQKIILTTLNQPLLIQCPDTAYVIKNTFEITRKDSKGSKTWIADENQQNALSVPIYNALSYGKPGSRMNETPQPPGCNLYLGTENPQTLYYTDPATKAAKDLLIRRVTSLQAP